MFWFISSDRIQINFFISVYVTARASSHVKMYKIYSYIIFLVPKSPAAPRAMFRIPILTMTTSLFLCWHSRAKTVISLIVSPTEGVMGGGGHFSWIVSSQAVASGPHLLFCKFKHSLVISAPGKANVDLRRKPACHWTPRDWATGSLKHLFLTPASALFHPLSLPKLWQKVCILGETPGDLMDMRVLFEMETHTFSPAGERQEYSNGDDERKWNK